MKILITGGAGMVGSHAAEYFALNNPKNEVILLDNLARSRIFGCKKASVEFNWNYLKRFKNIERITGDVRSAKDAAHAVGQGVDVVIHTAGQPGVSSSVKDPKNDFAINAFGTLNLLDAVRKKSKDTVVIFCSTNKVFGENVDKLPLVEKAKRYEFAGIKGVTEAMPTDLTGHTPYGVSKLTGDLYVQEYAHTYGLRTAVFRMSCIYGTRQFGFEDQGWIAWFTLAALFNRPVTICGNGKQVRDILYVDDLVDAFDRFIKSSRHDDVFNIGGGPDNTLSLLELLDELKILTGRKPKTRFADWRPFDQKVYITDTTKLKKTLRWQARTGVKEGLKKLVGWIKDNESYFV